MKMTRASASILAVATLSILAACGGGGGGGGTPPVGGGNGPGPTPTVAPTVSPTMSPTTGPIGVSSQDLNAEENFENPDMASWYTSGTASWTNHAGVTSTGNANGDGDNCDTTLTSDATGSYFHSHSFVGIMYNGTEAALPQAIGMKDPVEPTKGTPVHPTDNYEVENASCMFHVHTHDFSGLVHVEVPQQPFDATYNNLPAYANLQTLIDIWGASLTSSGLTAGSNSMLGPVTIYAGTSTAKDAHNNDLVNSYTLQSGAPSSIMLRHHEAIWIVIGTPPAAGLPQVSFVITN